MFVAIAADGGLEVINEDQQHIGLFSGMDCCREAKQEQE